ncbi:NnrS family protein [Kordiimonas lacus]|uniref:Uncharacterized protein involved in response to NO n=1 Tax=Kordiimonas lacus TaxID=637679 RepID=A0A1G7A9R9_9PROT|nr:NnrS family protein [Kordiimonas lacus]SDE11521.1 uncharacterized protein involved in response to NO [Kordiimonas lacus]
MSAKRYQGPAFLSFGFRPFFLLGGLAAAFLVPAWLYLFTHGGDLPGGMDPMRWHIHEMLFGYLAAVITGFLLTAIPNWTGRLPISGMPLLMLTLAWMLGRLAMLVPVQPVTAATVDSVFLLAVAAIVSREVIAGKNWRNAPVCLIISLLAASNIAFHIETLGLFSGDYAVRAALALIVLLNALIGGRIVPSFTTNWLIKSGKATRPIPFGQFDKILLLATAAALALWVVGPQSMVAGGLLVLVGAGHLVRLARWKGWATITSAIVLVLHAAYLWIPIGLALLGLDVLLPYAGITPSAGIHALTAGLMGLMPLAVMSRATLGHTGRELAAGGFGAAMYLAIFLSAALRVSAPLAPDAYSMLLSVSGLLWAAGFLMFVLRYGMMLVRPRKQAA